MKLNLNNPAFLQMAGNVGGGEEYIRFVDSEGSVEIILSADSDVKISYYTQGSLSEMTITKPTDETITIPCDANTDVFMYGKITKLQESGGASYKNDFTSLDLTHAKSLMYIEYYDDKNSVQSLDLTQNENLETINIRGGGFTSIDLSYNKKLEHLQIYETQLSEVSDLSKNTILRTVYLNGNKLSNIDISKNLQLFSCRLEDNPLVEIKCRAIAEYVADGVATAIQSAESTDGTVFLHQGDEFNQTISDAATTKGWTVEYVDA